MIMIRIPPSVQVSCQPRIVPFNIMRRRSEMRIILTWVAGQKNARLTAGINARYSVVPEVFLNLPVPFATVVVGYFFGRQPAVSLRGVVEIIEKQAQQATYRVECHPTKHQYRSVMHIRPSQIQCGLPGPSRTFRIIPSGQPGSTRPKSLDGRTVARYSECCHSHRTPQYEKSCNLPCLVPRGKIRFLKHSFSIP